MRRFTDKAAAAGVLTECEFAELDDMNLRLLFVGLTRTRIHLEWVMSTGTEQLLASSLMRRTSLMSGSK